MKTERRHELQENELANWLGDKINSFRPYGKILLGLLVLGLVALLVSGYVNSRKMRARQAAWTAYFDAMGAPDADSFETVSKSFPDTSAGAWALQTAGDLRLDEALRQMFQDRASAQQELLAAREIYERVAKIAQDPMLKQRATYGLAKCLESQGEVDQAQAQYEQITATWGDTQIGQLAQERLVELQKPDTKSWYTWFAAQEPVRSPLTDPNVFQDLPNLPDQPDLKMPEPGQLLPPSGSTGVDAGPTTTPDGSSAGDTAGEETGEAAGEATVPELDIELPGADQESSDTTGDPIKLDLGDGTEAADKEPETPLELDLDLELPESSATP